MVKSDLELLKQNENLFNNMYGAYLKINKAFNENCFTEEVKKQKDIIRELYFEITDLGHAEDDKLDKFLDKYQDFAAKVDNLKYMVNLRATEYTIKKELKSINELVKTINKNKFKGESKNESK